MVINRRDFIFTSLGMTIGISGTLLAINNPLSWVKSFISEFGYHSKLEKEIIDIIKNEEGMPPLSNISMVVRDLEEDKLIVSINDYQMRELASHIKPLITIGVFTEIDKTVNKVEGHRNFKFQNPQRYIDMIVNSDNSKADFYLDQLATDKNNRNGPQYLDRLLKKEYPDIFRSLSIVEYLGKGDTYNNKASTADLDRCLSALWKKRFPMSEKLLHLMNIPKEKVVEKNRVSEGTKIVPADIEKYDKTGSNHHFCGTMSILVPEFSNQKIPYTFTALIEIPGQKFNNNDEYLIWLKNSGNIIRNFSDMTYEHMKNKYSP